VVGLTTETTPEASSPGPTLRFTDAAAAADRAIAAIRAGGPATILLLSHLGLAADRALAARLPGVDVIVGGHSHSLLADLPGAAGPSPELVEGPDRTTRIVQAGAFGRWCGRLDLDLGADGRVLGQGGRVLPVTPDLPEDPAVAAIVAGYRRPLAALRARPVATIAAALPNAGCRQGECRLGSLVAEAMLAASPGAEIAVTNAGGLRAGLPAGAVSLGDVLEVLPFGNTLAWLTLRGGELRAALEIGLSRIAANGGGFPQVAGLRLRFDPDAPPGQRLREVQAASPAGWRPLEDGRAYRLVTNDFNRRGGDGYAPFRDAALAAYDNGAPLDEVVAGFLAAGGAERVALDGRIAGP
jgi:5'-nucleotidase